MVAHANKDCSAHGGTGLVPGTYCEHRQLDPSLYVGEVTTHQVRVATPCDREIYAVRSFSDFKQRVAVCYKPIFGVCSRCVRTLGRRTTSEVAGRKSANKQLQQRSSLKAS